MSQRAFVSALLDPQAPVPAGLTDGAGRATTRRFNVYRNNVVVSLTEALQVAFPVLRALIGEGRFDALAGLFLRTHPPETPLLMLYGAQFSDFIKNFEPLAHVPYLADIARIEQAQRESYHAADAVALTPDHLASFPAENLATARLRFAPAVRLVASQFPIHDIWVRAQDANAAQPGAQTQHILITRPEFDPVITRLTAAEGTAIAQLMDGAPLGDALVAVDAARVLGLLLSSAALTDID